MTIYLTGQLPSGKNAVQVTRTGQRYPKQRFKNWKTEAMRQLKAQRIHRYTGPIILLVRYTPGDKIRRDVPGLLDSLCHLLEYAGIVKDDAQVKNVEWTTWPIDPRKGRCSLTIISLEEITR